MTAAAPVATPKFVEPPPIPPEILKKDVEAWAIECGLVNVTVREPERENYPHFGFGYSLHVFGKVGGKERSATARYTAEGKRSYWMIDGMITG